MSKFIDAIKAEMTGRRYPGIDIPSLLEVSQEIQRVDDYSTLIEYKIYVTYGCSVRCKPDDLGKAKDNIVKSLREEIFGDVRKKAHEFNRAFYSGDREKINKATDELMSEILG